MRKELLTTAQAAELLGVGTTSIKRWSDSGVLRCVKTPGGHRRFPRSAVEEMLITSDGTPADHVGSWLSQLIEVPTSEKVYRRLKNERARRGSWWETATTIVPVLDELGRRWEAGELTVLEEHLASERLGRALARVVESLPVPKDAPQALLVTAEGDEHTLGLSLVEVCLREMGWNALWAGRNTPFATVRSYLASGRVDLVGVSASEYSSDAELLEAEAARYGALCREYGVRLALGGNGVWPPEPVYGTRVETLAAFREMVQH